MKKKINTMNKTDHNEELELFNNYFGTGGKIQLFCAPGRVNIIGEHLDYNGGYVLPAAISPGIYALTRKRNDDLIRMRSLGFPEEISFPISGDLSFDRKTVWGNYPRGVIAALKKRGAGLSGMDILFYATLPQGSGLSSSAAMEVLAAYIMQGGENLNSGQLIDTALLCQEVENSFIGVRCGIMDQFAVAMGKKNNAILLRSDDLKYRYVPFSLENHSLIIINSNKPRTLADSKYNERREECRRALKIIKAETQVSNLAEAAVSDLDLINDEHLKRRARHVISENRRTLEAVTLLEQKKLSGFGHLLTASHQSLQHDYEVTGYELDTLVEASLSVEGCLGARMTGAGFGGSAIALVKNEATDNFEKTAGKIYMGKTGIKADFFMAHITDGVRELDLQQACP